MSMHRSRAAAPWLLAAAAACCVGAAWADTAHTGKFHPWVLVALFWGVALVSAAIHHLSLYLARAAAALKRYRAERAAQPARLLGAARAYLAGAPAALTRNRLHFPQDLLRSLLVQGWNAVGAPGTSTKRARAGRQEPSDLLPGSHSESL